MNLSRAFALVSVIGWLGCSDGATASVDDPGSDAAGVETSTSEDTGAGVDSGTPEDAAVDSSKPPADYTAKGAATVTKSDKVLNGNKVHLLIPSGAAPAEGFPAVVFAHGFQLKETDYDDLLTHVASYGYVVLSTDYTASLLSNDHQKIRAAIVDGRAALFDGKLTGLPKVDKTRIASAGHSLGGKCATWAAATVPDFAATFVLDPVDGGGPLDTMSTPQRPFLIPTGELAKLTKPIGYVGATQSRCANLGTSCAPVGKDAAAFFGATPATLPRYLWTIYDFGHMQFLDNPACGFTCNSCVAGKSDVAQRKAWNKALFVAFLERHLRADASAQTWLDGPRRDEGYGLKQLWDGKIDRPACP